MPRQFTTEGIQQATRVLTKWVNELLEANGAALYKEGVFIMGESKKICPLKDRTLRGSAYVTRPVLVKSIGQIMVDLGYGGSAVDYAIAVHEKTGNGIQWTSPGTGPKYLERPFNKAMRGFEKRVGKRAQQLYKQGKGMNVKVGEFAEAPK